MTAPNPTFSIAMVCYNAQTFSMRAVESLLTRTHHPVRLHLLDNGSTDDTWAWMRTLPDRFPNIAVWHVPTNLGAQGGKVWILQHAAPLGEVIAIVDNDIEVFPGWDIPFAAWLADHPHAGILGGQGFVLDHPQGQRQIRPVYPTDHPTPADVITGFLTVLPRAAWDAVAYEYDATLNGYWHHDDDLCLQLQALGYTHYVMPDPAVIHYGSQSSREVPGLLSADQALTNQQVLLERWRAAGLVDAQGTPIRPTASPARPTIVWEGAVFQTHSLAHVNRQLFRHAVATMPAYQWAWHAADSQEREPWHYPDGWPLWSHRQSLADPKAVEIRHRYPPRWDRTPQSGGLVLMQPWEYQAVPPALVQGLNQADQVWVPSTYVQRIYIQAGVDPHKIHWIPNGVDGDRFTPQGRRLTLGDPDRVTFLFVGGLIPRKGYDLLWKAYLMAFGPTDPVQLVIRDVGTGSVYAVEPIARQLDQLARDPAIPRVIHLAQDIPERDLPALYRAADVVVQPYRAEGFCLPLLEAMACGVPIIAPEGGGSGDFVTPDCGWLLPTRPMTQWTLGTLGYTAASDRTPAPHDEPDLDALVAAFQAAASHTAAGRAHYGAAGRTQALHWSWDRSVRAMREAFTEFPALALPAPVREDVAIV